MPARSSKSMLKSSAAGSRPTPAGIDRGLPGDSDSSSQDSLGKLAAAADELKALAIAPMLRQAVAAVGADNMDEAARLAIAALEIDERCGLGWHVLGVARERLGDFRSAIAAYEAAIALLEDHVDVTNDLGRLAYRLGQLPLAAELFSQYRAARPDCPHGGNNLACVLRDLHAYPEAIETLKDAIGRNPTDASLWNTLGTVLSAQGDAANALVFFDEALRLSPDFAKARYNRGNVRLEVGDAAGALSDCETALAAETGAPEQAMMRLARSTILLCSGRVGEGWDAYEARLDPALAGCTQFACEGSRWTPETDLRSRSVLLIGEQGLGDEVMFANYIPDLVDAIGPDGRLSIAVEPRLVALFQRAFPAADVFPHETHRIDGHTIRAASRASGFDVWAPLASPLRRFRRTAGDFPSGRPYFRANPDRVAHWRETLAARGDSPRVGVLWKSLKLDGARLREFSPFDHWRPVLETPGVAFVNLQYGDAAEDIAYARERFGVEIWTPPGIDLKDDLDEVAALTCALDLVVGPANATSNIAGACGAPIWIISTPVAWPRLGERAYRWYPNARVFVPERYGQWEAVMREAASALGDWRDARVIGRTPPTGV